MRLRLLVALLVTGAPAFAQDQPAGRVGGRAVEPAMQKLPDFKAANVRMDGAIVEPVKLATPQVPSLLNMRQGRTTRGSTGYYGPRPPVGDMPHRYHFQLFALDALLSINPGSDRETLLAAMQGHVLGKGGVIGTYRQAAPPPK